jgi:transglutaminase superfamily protein/coenzyme PQQ synthesis protein D (PqqD)
VTAFVIPENVHTSPDADGRLVVLNERTGIWHALNATAADLYRRLTGTATIDHLVADMAARYQNVPRHRIRADVERTVAALVRRGLLEPAGHQRQSAAMLMAPPASTTGHGNRFVTAVAFVLALALLRLPFRVQTRMVTALKRRFTHRTATERETLRLLATTRFVSRHFPGRVACLELSLTTVLAAVLLGRRVDWCFGYATDPRRFHAWVAVDGTPVTEPMDDPIAPTYRLVVRV